MKLHEERVRGKRERLGLTIAMLARKAGTSKNTILSAEHGGDLRPTTARKIAEALGTEIDDLLGEVENPLSAAPSSQEKLFNNGSLEERRDPMLAGVIARVADAYLTQVADPEMDSDTAWGIVKAAQDLENQLSILIGAHSIDSFSGGALQQIARAMRILEDVEASYAARLEAELQRGETPPDQLAERRHRKEQLNERKASRTA